MYTTSDLNTYAPTYVPNARDVEMAVVAGRQIGDGPSVLPPDDPARYACGGTRFGNFLAGAIAGAAYLGAPVAAMVLPQVQGLAPGLGTGAAFLVGALGGGQMAANPRPRGVSTWYRLTGLGVLAGLLVAGTAASGTAAYAAAHQNDGPPRPSPYGNGYPSLSQSGASDGTLTGIFFAIFVGAAAFETAAVVLLNRLQTTPH